MKSYKVSIEFVLVLFLSFGFIACFEDQDEGRTITGIKEYTLTIASNKVLGLVSSYGNTCLAEVYAAKKGQSDAWYAQPGIEGFEYEAGYEYQIQVKETHYLDYRMGEPAWTEYAMSKLISKEKKESENLPSNFISDVFMQRVDIPIQYVIEAGNKELIETDLKTNSSIPWNCHFLFDKQLSLWVLCNNNDQSVVDYGRLFRQNQNAEGKGKYALFYPEEQVVSYMGWNFASFMNETEYAYAFDVTICVNRSGPNQYNAYLNEDLTDYYKNKYPEAEVRTVVLSLSSFVCML